ncbi:MAG: hypothetical protein U9Q24_01395 [Candidatus Ratteibacteria bacterium]|nr:hypothetical protein [Candidatus Ratteibacteria bacterium]
MLKIPIGTRILQKLKFIDVRELYDERMCVHRRVKTEFKQGNIGQYVQLALGITDNRGNYSAAEHGLGPRILSSSPKSRVFKLAQQLYECKSPKQLPDVVSQTGIKFLKISVGSEMAAMLRPKTFWVTNVRTIWAHLLIKHADDVRKANEELELYRDPERTSEMDYRIWSEIHVKLDVALTRLAELGKEEADRQKVKPGTFTYLWADAIANSLYEMRDRM